MKCYVTGLYHQFESLHSLMMVVGSMFRKYYLGNDSRESNLAMYVVK